ncbi:MAG: 3-oxoacyl-[acyl-carrier-protein] synthase III C-terminal domain-containing protein, partial [Butyricicoccaceae bacterium]
YMGADGASGEALLAKALPVEDPFGEDRSFSSSDRFLKMDGKAVYRFTAKAVPHAIESVIQRGGVDIADVDWIVPHQANTRIIDMVIRRYGLDPEKVFVNLPYYGNTSSASVPLCLDDMRRKGLLKKGQLAVFVGFGGGLTYGSILIRV